MFLAVNRIRAQRHDTKKGVGAVKPFGFYCLSLSGRFMYFFFLFEMRIYAILNLILQQYKGTVVTMI